MVPLTSLLVPVVVSAAIVFVASSIIHMMLPYHRSDLRKLSNEDELMDALRRLDIPPGDYCAPHPGSPENMRKPEFIAKMEKGPRAFMTISAGAPMAMGGMLLQWFVYSVVISLCSGYVASRALGPGAHYLSVFRFVGTTAFMGYAMSLPQHSIWYKRNWVTTAKSMFDGLIYGCLTAGTFGWLWPR